MGQRAYKIKSKTANLIKQAALQMGVRPGKLVVGDVREAMARQDFDEVEKLINKKAGRREKYWILVLTRGFWNGEVKSFITALAKKPPKSLSTYCLEVDNKRGSVKRLWCLPHDAPMPVQVADEEPVREVAESASDINEAVLYG